MSTDNVTLEAWLDQEMTTANLSSTATTKGPDTLWIKETGFYINFCSLAVIIPIGLVCNAFSIGIFMTASKFRRTSTGQLLIALSAVDWLVLVGDGMRWLSKENNRDVFVTGLDFYHTSDFACKFVNISRYSMKLLSGWLTVVITIERFAAVAMPLKVGRLSTPFRMRCTVAVLALVCIAVSLFPAWTLGSVPYGDARYCSYVRDDYTDWVIGVLRVGTFALPTTLLVIFSSLIIYFIARAQSTRPQSTRGGARATTTKRSPSKDKAKSTQRQLTIMLVAICVAYFVLQLPYMILYFLNDRKKQLWPDDEVKWAWIYAGKEITEAASISNHAVNFFLYCVSGSAFRRHVSKTCSCCGRGGGARDSRCLDATGSTWCPSAYRPTTSAASPAVRLHLRRQRDNDAEAE